MPENKPIIMPLGGYIPIEDIEPVDEAQKIYKGKVVDYPGRQANLDEVFFSRDYQPEHNELDQIFTEKTISAAVTGKPFLLVPKEKLLFGRFSPGLIALPSPNVLAQKRRTPQ